MSDLDVTIPSTSSQEMNESQIPDVAATEPESVIVSSDSDKASECSLTGSKIVKPSGLRQPGSTSAGTTRIGRPCNNIPKPAIPRQNWSHKKDIIRKISQKKERLRKKARLKPGRSFFGRSSTKLTKIESLARLSDYSNSLRYTYAKTFNHLTSYNGGYYGRVSLRDIGIRQPVVHFDLDYDHFRSSGGIGGGGTMASASSLRKASDDFARRRISDLSLGDENSIPFFGGGKWISDRKSSSGSVLSDSSRKSSTDDLRRKKSSDGSLSLDSSGDYWKFDHEPRRASDVSVVLTQDTDSFIIGDRVWVGGTKPGQIAYIGETQFAPGDWAGVVLDEPIGKNDGSVANIRYFQCEPKRGIFSRLTRLTRYPLLDGNSVEVIPPRTLSLDSSRNDGPNAKAVPKKLTPVPTPTTPMSKSSFSKPSSPDSSIHPNVSVGDRVIVMSSQGSKAGVLRFLGATDFAPGEWCGVELDDPLGKNDGSVAGTRYFECRPKFGLFAPLHKVSKSPASRRPSQASCQIHRGGGSVGIRRQGSRESLASMSSVASAATSLRSSSRKVGVRTPSTTPTSTKNTLQETLKERELHIEKLQKERDLERAEVTRAASQADEAEKRLSIVQKELEQCKEKFEAKIADLDAKVCLLKAEKEDLAGQLDEEKKKYEDAQFRFEEISIETGDLNMQVKNLEDKATMLEKNLADERKRVEVLELESNKLFEAEEQLVIVKDENDLLKEKLAQNEELQNSLKKEHAALEAVVISLRAEIVSLKTETEITKNRDEDKLRESLSETKKALEETRLEVAKKQEALDQMVKELENKENSFTLREKEQSEKYLALVKDLTEKHKLEMAEINGKLEELKISSDLKMKVLEEKVNERTSKCNDLETQVQEYNLKLSKAASDSFAEKGKREEAEEKLEKELNSNRETLKRVTDDLEKQMENCKQREKTIDELRSAMKGLEEKLKESVESKETQVSALNEIINAQKNELELARNETDKTMNDLRQLEQSLKLVREGHDTKLKDLGTVIMDKDVQIEKLSSEIERLKKDYETDSNKQKELYEKCTKELESKIMEREKFQEEEKQGLKKHQMEIESLLKTKDEELLNEKKLKENLLEKLRGTEESQKLLTSEKENLLLEAGDSNRKLQSFEEKLKLMTKQKEKLENDLTAFISSSNDSSAQLTRLNDELRLRERQVDALRQELSDKITAFERAQQEHDQILSSKENEFNAKEKTFADKENEMIREMDKLRKELENASANRLALEKDLKSKMDGYAVEVKEQMKCYEEKINSLEHLGQEKAEKYDQNMTELRKSKESLEVMLKASEDNLKKLEDDKKKNEEGLKAENDKLKKEIQALETEKTKIKQELSEKAKQDGLKHISEGEKLKKEIEETSVKLKTALMQIEEMVKEKARTDEEKAKLQSSVIALEETCKRNKTEMENRSSELENENNILKNSLAQLREEKWTVDKNATDKEMIITDLQTQLKSAHEWKKKGEEKDKTIKALEDKVCEIEKLRDKEITERDSALKKLTLEISVLNDGMEKMKSNAEANTGKTDELKHNLEVKIIENLKKEEEVNKLQKNLDEVRDALANEKKISEGNQKKVNDLEKEKSELLKMLEKQGAELEKRNESNVLLQELTKKVKEGDEKLKKAVGEAENVNKSLEERENIIKNLTNDIETLKLERSSLLNNNKITVESLEKEKTQLQKKIEEMETNNQGIGEHNINVKGDENILEDREFTQGQVDFLNSVIVDMQKKNDALKARIEILEMGFSPEDVEDYTLENLKRTAAPPRLFCDICDVFDLHDTEDCPTQAMDPDVPPPRTSKAAPPPPRPYCDICEVFGHDTCDCDDAETF